MTETTRTAADASNLKPEDDRETVIGVNDVTMVFNIASEQLNNLKEYAIAIAKRELMFKEFKALQHITFDVKKGDVFGILGTNGSGKSTMMKIIAGVLEPSEGSCVVKGNIAPLIELGAGFDMDLTARENIYLNGALLGYSRKFIDENFDEIVDFAEVRDFLDMPLKNYSSGMVARIAFAIATVIVPEILLVDEVLSVGDFMFQKKCENRIKELINQGVTVLIVSHSNDQIARMCNKAVWIEKGHMRMAGDAEDVCRVYGSLGGRRGSKESEKRIEQELKNTPADLTFSSYFSNNPFELTAMTAEETARRYDGDTVVMISSATHINAAFGSAFAGALDAPIMICTPDSVPLSEQEILAKRTPSTIYFIDCGRSSQVALQWLQNLPWKPTIIDLSGSGNPAEYSCMLATYGAKKGLWGTSCFAADFVDDMEVVALIPHLRASKSPLLVAWSENPSFEGSSFEEAIEPLAQCGITDVVVAGKKLPESLVAPLAERFTITELARTSDSPAEQAIAIARFSLDYAIKNNPEEKSIGILVGGVDTSQRLYMYSASNKTLNDSVLLLHDMTDMDGVVGCLDFLCEYKSHVKDVSFIGTDNAFLRSDCLLLQNAVQ